jgi:MFS family permease
VDTDRLTTGELARVRRRSLGLLAVGQVLGGLGTGSALSVGALAANDLAGAQWSGMAATMSTLGAALLAVPLARLSDRRGRRPSLTTAALVAAAGVALCAVGIAASAVLLLFLGLAAAGAATAAALQSRFAATDLATGRTRGRDLSLVVWSTTVGAVIGPNLAEPGAVIGQSLGLPALSGVFVFAAGAQLLAAATYAVLLRPDPLLLSRTLLPPAPADGDPGSPPVIDERGRPERVRLAITTLALSHATMVALMAMTPVHLVHGGASLSVVGLTISLHIAGMFALSPLFGVLSDRLGRIPTMLAGQGLLVAAAVVTALAPSDHGLVMTGLILLGLGWSAATIAGSALLTESAPAATRVRLQGRSDMVMSFAGAIGGALSGPVLAFAGYAGLAWGILLPIAVVGLAALRTAGPAPARDAPAVDHSLR